MRRTPRRTTVALSTLVTVTVLLASCSGGSDDETQATATAAAPTTTTTTTTTPPPPPVTAVFTGKTLKDDKIENRGVVAIKIDNAPEARPQVAIDRADLVFEEPVEGGITRLMAVFQSQNPGRIGPVRSGRVTDPSILRALGGGALAFSGASGATYRRIRGTPHVILMEEGQIADWQRDYSRRAPHNLFVDQSSIRKNLGKKLTMTPQAQFASFSDTRPSGGSATKKARLTWQFTTAEWSWGPKAKAWLRTQNGTPDNLADGTRIKATNVLMIQATTRTDPGLHDVNGALTPLPDLEAGGKMWLLRDGRVYRGTWSRAGTDKPFTIKSSEGTTLTLDPGNTWIEILPKPATPTLS